MSEFRYESVYANASLQFYGHFAEYLIANTRSLCLFYAQPRFGAHPHLVRRYEAGKLIEEREVRSSARLVPYYWLWLYHHLCELVRFCRGRKTPTLMVFMHPLNLFGMSLWRRLYRLRYVYWVGDYFPSRSLVIRAFEALKRFYGRRADYTYYLSDAINAKMNGGKVLSTPTRKTIAWGVQAYPECAFPRTESRRLLFVGLLRDRQGIEDVLSHLAVDTTLSLTIVGVAANGFERVIRERIAALGLAERVDFPHRFYSQAELMAEAKRCFAGVALYDLDAENFTHYADPGKVKAYLEMGLPVVMTRISGVAKEIEHFHAGETIASLSELPAALSKVRADPVGYADGVRNFCNHFDACRYYAAKSFGT